MDHRSFFKNLTVSDNNILRMIKEFLKWTDKKNGVGYTLRQQQRIAITIEGSVKGVLFIGKAKDYIYVQLKDYYPSFVEFVRSNISAPENIEVIHQDDPNGPIFRFRVNNDSDLNVLKKIVIKYLD